MWSTNVENTVGGDRGAEIKQHKLGESKVVRRNISVGRLKTIAYHQTDNMCGECEGAFFVNESWSWLFSSTQLVNEVCVWLVLT